jgi:DNA-directed RNA polymerase beta' subunit
MILDVIPVIPPELRPMVQLDGGRFATSDLNDLYRRVINRNNRLKKLIDLNAPEVIIRNEKRMLQQAVDALFDNDRTKRPVLGSSNRPLKSLTDMIKGKQGRFRENLLGKRVDYSARSVIVCGPELKLHQCGLPKKIALELFQPFIIRRLKELGYVDTIKSAKKMLERRDEEVWDILDEVIHEHPVLLNRAPTLHRMGIQAFEPTLVEGNAIKIHPLVCEAFNADFDGDQMAVHLPLSVEAQAEASILMMSTNNIFSPADGEPIIRPSLDMVLGNYYLTYMQEDPYDTTPKIFSDTDETLFALEEKRVHLQQPIQVRMPAGTVVIDENGERELQPPCRLTTTAGRIKFNDMGRVGNRFYNLAMGKKAINRMISDCHRLLGRAETIRLLDDLKDSGFREATLSGISICAEDLQMPADKYDIIGEAQVQVEKYQKNYTRGHITENERHHQITETWTHATNRVADRVMQELKANVPKYEPLESFLRDTGRTGAKTVTLSVDDIQRIIGQEVAPSAKKHAPFWYDAKSHGRLGSRIARAGWRVKKLEQDENGNITGAQLERLLHEGKYAPLEELLRSRPGNTPYLELSVSDIEGIIGKPLPESAKLYEQYWRSTTDNPLGAAISCAGWRVTRLDRGIVGVDLVRSPGKPGKYVSLTEYLQKQRRDALVLSVAQVEEITKEPLPDSARQYDAYWRDTTHNPLGVAIAVAGWEVQSLERNAPNSETPPVPPKYAKLREYLEKQRENSLYLSIDQVKKVVGESLPDSARQHDQYWRDKKRNPLGVAIAAAGWNVASLRRDDKEAQIVGANLERTPISYVTLRKLSGFSKYAPLREFLEKAAAEALALSLSDVEKICKSPLPESAKKHEPYWRDTTHNPLGVAITAAGWKVDRVVMGAYGARLERTSTINPIWCMFDSGARGSAMQIRQMAGMRGLMAKPSGEIMETPIKANFREGLPVLEYFSSTHGGRKGLADTALKTAESGYLTRKLADVTQHCVVSMNDCGTTGGVTKTAGEVGLAHNIYGRTAAETVVDRRTGETICEEGTLITRDIGRAIEELGYDSLRVRSVMTCEAPFGFCAKCYGMDLSTQQLVEEGLAVGIIAAQSIGEPGTQLTMRTFHVGGIATTGGSAPDSHAAEQDGIITFENVNSVEDPERDQVVLNQNGQLILSDAEGREIGHYPLSIGSKLMVKDGEKVKAKKVLARWDPHVSPIITEKAGTVRFADIEEGETMRVEIDAGGSQHLVITEHKGDLHPQIVIEDSSGEILGIYSIPEKAYIDVKEGERVPAGARLARTPRQAGRTQDITAGLPRVTELFEARKPKDPAIISEISGVVHLGERKRGRRSIIVRNEAADMEREHLVPQGKRMLVTTGSYVREGDPLVDGPQVPHDILRVKGEEALQQYLLDQIQTVYRFCGEEINDKHMEVIISQMLRKVQVGEDVGDTNLLPGQIVDKFIFRNENKRVVGINGRPASAQSLLLGITKAALRSESFISAASFQETTKVLTEAALAGKQDGLVGLKENVILGHMIPAGTGFITYRNAIAKQLELPEPSVAAGGD